MCVVRVPNVCSVFSADRTVKFTEDRPPDRVRGRGIHRFCASESALRRIKTAKL